jgi:hypothetical protein
MAIEIDENTIVRTLVRKGTDSERQQVVLEPGELGYTTNYTRLFVGDGTTTGGVPVGVKYYGSVSDFSTVGNLSPQPGDFFISGTGLYARNYDSSGSINDSTGYTSLGISATVGAGLSINSSAALIVSIDGTTITLTSDNELTIGSVPLTLLASIPNNTIVGNGTGAATTPEAVAVGANSVLARISTVDLASVTFDNVLSYATAPVLSQLTVTDLAGASNNALVVASTSGRLSRLSPTAGTTNLNSFFYFDTPYQIFGNYPDMTDSWNGAYIQGDGTLITIDPWTTAGIVTPDGVIAAIVYGSVDNTTWPISSQGGESPRLAGQDGKLFRKGFSVFVTRDSYTNTYQPLFNAAAGEGRRWGITECVSGSGHVNAILDGSGNFLVGGFGNIDNFTPDSTVNLYCKLFLVGYAI